MLRPLLFSAPAESTLWTVADPCLPFTLPLHSFRSVPSLPSCTSCRSPSSLRLPLPSSTRSTRVWTSASSVTCTTLSSRRLARMMSDSACSDPVPSARTELTRSPPRQILPPHAQAPPRPPVPPSDEGARHSSWNLAPRQALPRRRRQEEAQEEGCRRTSRGLSGRWSALA